MLHFFALISITEIMYAEFTFEQRSENSHVIARMTKSKQRQYQTSLIVCLKFIHAYFKHSLCCVICTLRYIQGLQNVSGYFSHSIYIYICMYGIKWYGVVFKGITVYNKTNTSSQVAFVLKKNSPCTLLKQNHLVLNCSLTIYRRFK